MFIINNEEAKALYKAFSDAEITICSKRKKNGGKTYWCSENTEYKAFIENMRNNAKT